VLWVSDAYLWKVNAGKGKLTMAQKKVLPKETPFLNTAAEAIGTALGKLAVRTGVVTPPDKAKAKKAVAPKKATAASKKGGVASRAKKPAKKTRP
jgi:hypothetical protein